MKLNFLEINKEKIIKILKNNLFIAVSINLIFFLLLVIFFDIKYQTNDDFGISMFTSKSYGEQFYFLGFTNFIYMYIVAFLQNSINIINWHVGLQIVFSFSALVSITYVLFECNRGIIIRSGILLLIAIVTPQFYIAIQFTKSSALIILAGYLLVLCYLKLDYRKLMLFIGVILVTFGSLIRFENFLMVSLFSFFICFFEIFINQKFTFNRKGLIIIAKYATIFGILFAIVFGVKFIGTMVENKNYEVSYYLNYTKYRSDLLDFGVPDYNDNKEEYKKLNISKEDLDVLKTWTFADPDKFDLKTFEAMATLKSKDVKTKDWGQLVKTIVHSITINKAPVYLLELKIVFALICLIFLFKSNLKKKLYILAVCILIALLYMYLAYIGRIVTRAEYGIWLSAITFLIYYFEQINCLKSISNKVEEIESGKLYIKYIITTIFAIGIIFVFSSINSNITYDKRYKNFVEIAGTNKDDLYLIDVFTFINFDKSYNAILPMKNDEYSNIYLLGGCHIKSPTTDKILINYNVKNPFKDAIDNNKIFIVDNNNIEQKLEYIKRNYDKNAYAVHTDNIEGFDVYQIKTKK